MTPARFQVGDAVVIQDRTPQAHHRVPGYAKGAPGVIERVCDAYGQPETLGVGQSGEPLQTLYRVRLRQSDLWSQYVGSTHDTLDIEIFEHWLDPAAQP